MFQRKQFLLQRDKIPLDYRTGQPANPHDPEIWLTHEQALNMAEIWGVGIGFTFTADDPYWFLDVDKCLKPDGNWSDLALELCGRFPGAYMEVSQSGKGLHVIGSTDGPVPPHACKNTALGIEFYTEGRYVALAGTGAQGDPDSQHGGAVAKLVTDYFPQATADTAEGWTAGPVPEWSGPADDMELVTRALMARSAASVFGGENRFAALWSGDPVKLGEYYPMEGRAYDASSADAALAQMLAFWTGKDCERMQRIMQQSQLVRDKWNRKDYLKRTIVGACGKQRDVFNAGGGTAPVPVPTPLSVDDQPVLVTELQYLDARGQIELFKGCTYVLDQHRVFTPYGMLSPERFQGRYGRFLFQHDAIGEKTTKKAWEAFVESQAVHYPIADSTCFRPDLPTGKLIERQGRFFVNTYKAIPVRRRTGDVSPFLNHLAKILPDEHDRAIILAYMAACVQHQGKKFQWCPLIQGTEGNGKTLITMCIKAAIGDEYTHMPRAADIDNKFNGWIVGKTFIGVEDIYVPETRREVIEAVKPMITGTSLDIQSKGVDQYTAHDICANFVLNSNHRDAIRKSRNDRRFSIFYCAQQNAEDLIRDGMGGNYFPDLYDWLKIDGGYEFMADFLMTYTIPEELNPATKCHRAPETSTQSEVYQESLGSLEQEILEYIEEGRHGFAGGWVSSTALDDLLENMRLKRAIPQNKRREIMQSLGYDWHPALTKGRSTTAIASEGGKRPRLFIKNDHLHRNLKQPAEIVRCYVAAQPVGNNPFTAAKNSC